MGEQNASLKVLAFSAGLVDHHQAAVQLASTTASEGAALQGSLAPDVKPHW